MAVKEFTHELKEVFKYSNKGEFCEANLITIKAPKGNMIELMIIDGLCAQSERRALSDVADLIDKIDDANKEKIKQLENEKDDDSKALDAYNSLFAGLKGKEYSQFDISFKEILKQCAVVDNEKTFEDSFYNELSMPDKRLLIGKYIVNFTSSSQAN